MPSTDVDICVIGGGPGGSVIARLLAHLGHKTLLIDRSLAPPRSRVESLAPTILPILDLVDLSHAIEPSIFHRERFALVRWDTETVQTKLFEPPSLLVDRCHFDRSLSDAAANAGVHVLLHAHARAPERRPHGGWLVPVMTAKGLMSVAANFLVDARGKRRSARSQGPRTVAISAAWSRNEKPFFETRIETGADEWIWGCPMPDGQYSVTVFVDATKVAGLRGEARSEIYRRLLSRSQLLRNLLQGEQATPVSVRDATSRSTDDLIGEGFIRVGEAAFAIDPLSSQGVQRAILSAIQGAAAVHTLLRGHDPNPATTFYRDSHRAAATHASRMAERLYRDRLRKGSSKFWIDRAGTVEAPAAATRSTPDVPFALPSFVRLSDALKIVTVPTLLGAVIAPAAALSHPRLEQPIAYLGDIALAPLMADLVDGMGTDQLVAQWGDRMPPTTALHVLRWMFASGILVAGDITSSPNDSH